MVSWQHVLTHLANNAEDHFDKLKNRLRKRLDLLGPLMIAPYRGCGTQEVLYLRGRVLEDMGITSPSDNDSVWANLVNMYRRFDSHEAPTRACWPVSMAWNKSLSPTRRAFSRCGCTRRDRCRRADRGIRLSWNCCGRSGRDRGGWRRQARYSSRRPTARYAVISDIDDTVVQTNAASLLRMARVVFLGNARTRLPFKGVAAFYRALYGGVSGEEMNPLFYVSSSPWNLYDLFCDFFNLQNIPAGPILFLRDWGLTEDEILPLHNRNFKLATIQKILTLYPDLPFILIGDSGQEDPEIYQSVVNAYPNRVLAAYIRNVSRDPTRSAAIRGLAEKIVEAGSTLILAEDTEPLARHAAEQGWISPATLEVLRAARRADEAPPNPIETLLGVAPKEPGPTQVVEGREAEDGGVERALKSGDRDEEAPTVVVESQGDAGKRRAAPPDKKGER